MMKPAKIANPPARTPNTPDARAPSVKELPSGALRRTASIAPIVATLTTTRMTMAQRRLMAGGHPSGWRGTLSSPGAGDVEDLAQEVRDDPGGHSRRRT